MADYTAKQIGEMEAGFGGGFVKVRAELGFPLRRTGWTVGQQPPLLEGAPASSAWDTLLAEQKG